MHIELIECIKLILIELHGFHLVIEIASFTFTKVLCEVLCEANSRQASNSYIKVPEIWTSVHSQQNT